MAKKDFREIYFRKYGIVTVLVFEIIAFVVVGLLIGQYLDKKIGTHGLLLALGAILGFVAGIYKFYFDSKRFLK